MSRLWTPKALTWNVVQSLNVWSLRGREREEATQAFASTTFEKSSLLRHLPQLNLHCGYLLLVHLLSQLTFIVHLGAWHCFRHLEGSGDK